MTLAPTRGPEVCRWIERFLVHGEGDYYGKPFRLTDEQRAFIWRAYETSGDVRKYRRALLGLPKGNGKSELGAALACAELAGPTAPASPHIIVAAASYEQAEIVFGAAKVMLGEGPLGPYFECFDKEIHRKDGPGRIERVAAEAGTNDGARPTFLVADEVHEWIGRKERVHLVLANGLAKRRDAWALNISTAGSDTTSLLGRLYAHGREVESGVSEDETFLFSWREAPADADLSTNEGLREALMLCNPGISAGYLNIEDVVARFREIPEYEARRYFCNQWTATPDMWLPTGAWSELTAEREVEPGTEIVLAFDGSYNGDSSGLVAATCDEKPYMFVVDVWEKPQDDESWIVPREAVKARVRETMERYRVRELACDPPGWHAEIEEWAERYSDSVVIRYETNRRKQMSEACSRFYSAVVAGLLSHDGNSDLARHLGNCVVKETQDGAYVTKDGRHSPRKIDLAIAAIVAYDRAAAGVPVGGLWKYAA